MLKGRLVARLVMAGWAVSGAAATAMCASGPEGPTTLERTLERITSGHRSALVQVESHRPQSTSPRTGSSLLPASRTRPYRVLRSTGVIVDAHGHILTCADTAQPTDSIVVRAPGGEAVPASFVSQEAATGLTLLSAAIPRAGAALVPGTCNAIREGDLVLVISIRDQKHRSELGILTKIRDGAYQGSAAQLELQLARPEGMCGGVVLDGNGSLVGLLVDCGGSLEGAVTVEMPVSLPARALTRAAVFETAARLERQGRRQSGFLGVQADRVGLASAAGEASSHPVGPVAIVHVLPGSPAEIAGLAKGDQIVELAGLPVSEVGEVSRRIDGTPPGTWVTITVLREGNPLALRARVGDRTMLEWMEWSFLRLGLARQNIRSEMDRLEISLDRVEAAAAAYQ